MKNVSTRKMNGVGAKSKASRLTDPPSAEYTRAPSPVASIYWAVLNQIRTNGFFRTNVSVTRAVTPLISIGHGWLNSATEAISGMNPTELLTFARGIRTVNESLTIASMAKAARAFQSRGGRGAGTYHSGATSTYRHAALTTATSA